MVSAGVTGPEQPVGAHMGMRLHRSPEIEFTASTSSEPFSYRYRVTSATQAFP